MLARQRAAAEQEEAERKSKVVTLTSASFDELVLNSKEPWIIKFYAPWCGHCKRLAPVWHRLSSTVQESGNNVNVAKVDCTVHRRVCSRFGVTGYPSIWYINDGTVYKYQAARKLDTYVPIPVSLNGPEALLIIVLYVQAARLRERRLAVGRVHWPHPERRPCVADHGHRGGTLSALSLTR